MTEAATNYTPSMRSTTRFLDRPAVLFGIPNRLADVLVGMFGHFRASLLVARLIKLYHFGNVSRVESSLL
jgi:hypothetical protein